MTDEEKAEEYVLSLELEKGNKILQLKEVIKAIYKAFFNGLTEGRKEKWHNLRKDPDDLPEEDCTEVMFVTKNNETLTGIYKNGGGEGTPIFDTFGIAFYDVEQVIAWCELPKFKE